MSLLCLTVMPDRVVVGADTLVDGGPGVGELPPSKAVHLLALNAVVAGRGSAILNSIVVQTLALLTRQPAGSPPLATLLTG